MARGYIMIDPSIGAFAPLLNNDQQVQCISYLIKHLNHFATLPEELNAEPIPYGFLGAPYPTIGLYQPEGVSLPEQGYDGWMLENALEEFVQEIGTIRLLELAADETMTWQELIDLFRARDEFLP